MKKILIVIGLSLLAIGAMAQTKTGTTVFKTADGKIIPSGKIDSVTKALGGKVNFMKHEDQPGIIYIVAKSAAGQKMDAENKAKLASLIGKPAPVFSVTDLSGKKYELSALKGKVIVLNFWFIACAGCVAEMPELNKIKSEYNKEQVIFLAFALDKADQLREFKKKHDFTYAIVPDAGKVHKDFGVYACPVSIVIGRNGLVSAVLESDVVVDKLLPEAINTALNRALTKSKEK